jgi:Mrp family chromosome partitioning ATPase/uncharacterized protein involved in exopolysaccharide biosynthesis
MTRAALPTSAPSPKPAAAPRPKPAAISLDPVRLLRQHVWGIISTLVIGAILGVILNYVFLYTYQVWSGTVFLEIRSQLKDAKALNAEDLGTEEAVIRLAQTEVARMMSRDNIKMALASDDVQKTEWSNSSSFRDEKNIFNIDEAATELENDLRGAHKRGTQIFTLAWRTQNPEDVPVVLNAVASTYVTQVRANEDNRFATILRVYEANQKKLDDQIAAKKQEIQKFVKERNMTSLNESSSENSRALEKLRDGIANTTSELSVAESRKAQAEEKQSGAAGFSDEDLRDADNDPVMQNLNRDFEDASRRYEASTKQFGEKHSEVLQLKAAQSAVDKQRTDTRKKILLRNQLADLRGAANRVQSLTTLLKKQQEDFAKNSVASEDFTMNMAELGTLREQLSQAEDQRQLVSQTINDVNLARLREESQRVEVVQRAIKPREITFPQLKFMVPGTAVLVCGIYILILFVREILDQRIKYPSDLMGLPGKILGVIPDISDDPTKPKRAELIVFESPHSMTAESFRQSDSLITKGLAPTNAKIILVMSPMPGSGTTTMVLNLAACDASVGRRTLLVGANLRRPRLGKALGLDPNLPGLGDIFNGANPSSILIDQGNGLHFIGAGAPSNRTFQLLNTEKMDAFLDWCHQNYDRVYLDAPPSIVAGEGLALANKADASILVVRAWQYQKGLVTKLAYQLMDSKSNFLGTILNRPKNTAGGYFKKNAEAIAEYAADTAAFQLSAGQATSSVLSKDGPKPTTT